jgi:flagellar assembly factor FliW
LRFRAIANKHEEIEVEEDNIIELTQGLIGFPNLHKYVILQHEEAMPFQWLQCIEDSYLAFVIINPLIFRPTYKIELAREEVVDLRIDDPAQVRAYSIVTIYSDPGEITANLQAPILINNESRLGKQVILMNTEYNTRHLILEEFQENRKLKPPKDEKIVTLWPTPNPP